MPPFFEVTAHDPHTQARAGIMHTAHGDIETPVFMPVGTQATVKTLDSADLRALNAQIILGNTYHLHLRPHEDTVARLGGLHSFMNWARPLLTDSGGFQVFSLGAKGGDTEGNPHAGLISIDDGGVTFHSHIDGSTHRFTPEISLAIQKKLGADIIMAFDECTPDRAPRETAERALTRTHAWAEESLAAHERHPASTHTGSTHRQFLFGIIQGGSFEDLRKESTAAITSMPFDGIAIGGESIGYNMEATKEILAWVSPLLPESKPHYTMGVGVSPQDLFDVVERGVDMFDCVAPTRMARNGSLYLRAAGAQNKFRIAIGNAAYREDTKPIDPECTCFTCANHTRAYVHHLFRAEELLAYRLATIHNVHFMLTLMRRMRTAILAGKFLTFKEQWIIPQLPQS